MSINENTPDEKIESMSPQSSSETAEQTPDHSDHMIPKSRLDEVLGKNRGLQTKVDEYEKAKETERNKTLSVEQLNVKIQQDLDSANQKVVDLQEAGVRKALGDSFSSKLIEAGMSAKIAKMKSQTVVDLTEDNVDSKVKEIKKQDPEFFTSKEVVKPTSLQSPFAISQPKGDDTIKVPTKSMGELAREVVSSSDHKI